MQMQREIRVVLVCLSGVLFNREFHLLNDMQIPWFKRCREYFNIQNDIYLGNVYIVPEGSRYWNDYIFDRIKGDISQFPDNVKILICGDDNARNGTLSNIEDNTLNGTDKGLNELIPHQFLEDGNMNIPRRHSMDKASTNNHGKQLIELCKSTGLVLFNGIIWAAKWKGEHTRVDSTGCSVVDYVIGSSSLLNNIIHFTILPKLPESDHRPITCFWVVSFGLTNEKLTREITGYHMTNMNGPHLIWLV